MYKLDNENFTRLEKGRSILSIPSSFVVFDLETTGLDSKIDEIIEIGAIKVIDNKIVDKFQMLVKPNGIISPFITNLTGITNRMVENASCIEDVLPLFLDFVGDFILVGHNVNFDVNFIYDYALKVLGVSFKNDFVDTLRLSRKLLKNLYRHKLGEIAHYYGIDTSGSHRSLKDVEMTLAIFYKLQEEIVNQYGSFLEFENSFSYVSVKANEISVTSSSLSPNSLFYGKYVVITGTLDKMVRREAMQVLRNMGANLEDQVTIRTDFLIVGTHKSGNHKSAKLRMAESLQAKGYGIQIVSASSFYEQLKEKSKA